MVYIGAQRFRDPAHKGPAFALFYMIGDTAAELATMAAAIGLRPLHVHGGAAQIGANQRRAALERGAIELEVMALASLRAAAGAFARSCGQRESIAYNCGASGVS